MKTKTKQLLMLLTTGVLALASCKKEKVNENESADVNGIKTFHNITFTPTQAYFSTNGTMSAPVDSTQAKSIVNKIDITFIYDADYTEAGFLDPKVRSQEYYWNDHYKPWLNAGVETKYYSTNLTKSDFDAAQQDPSKIAGFFSNSSTVLAPHAIFPAGSCIGGRQSNNPTSITLSPGQVFIFLNVSSSKRGLIYIRTDQAQGWPWMSSSTKVDIIREG